MDLLSIVVPTFNERDNIEELVARLDQCLGELAWEVIVVDDDSPDGTADVVGRLAALDTRVRCLHRVGRRGLASACLEGMALAHGEFVAIMDADLQHDERLLPSMRRTLVECRCDVVVGSRYTVAGGVGEWSRWRRWMSRAATALTRLLLDVELADPMSGFFMLHRSVMRLVAGRLSGKGFKLLLDLVVSAPRRLRVVELPYMFAPRRHGRSKLDTRVLWHFVRLLVAHWTRRVGGPMARFCLVGAHGVLVHVAVLDLAQQALGWRFAPAQALAVAVSLFSNFVLNNRLTFGAAALQGRAFVSGLFRFAALCSLGAIVNVTTASVVLHLSDERLLAAAVGILAGAVCNYASAALFVWTRSPKLRT